MAPREAAQRVGRTLLYSALTIVGLAFLFGSNVLSVEDSMRKPLVGALVATALLDALCGYWFLRRAR